MARYFFNITDGSSISDDEGTELASIAEAKLEAVRLAGSLMRDNPEHFLTSEDWSIDVTDESGLDLFSYTFFASESPALFGRKETGKVDPIDVK